MYIHDVLGMMTRVDFFDAQQFIRENDTKECLLMEIGFTRNMCNNPQFLDDFTNHVLYDIHTTYTQTICLTTFTSICFSDKAGPKHHFSKIFESKSSALMLT